MFISIIKAIILGIVEGVTEFLPISSTGHLILVNEWLSFGESFTKMFDVVIQLGAILSIVVFFWHRLWPFTQDKEKNNDIWSLWFKAVFAVLPALVLGALLGDIIEEKLFNPSVVALSLIVGGIVILVVENSKRIARINSISEVTYKTALFIGFIQSIAMIPGTSRSAATIIGAMLLGTSRVVAAEFSFFLAIPTMVAASAYSLLKHGVSMTSSEIIVLAIGFFVAFFVALLVIKALMNFIKKNNFKIFGYYRIVLGVIIILYFLTL